LNGDEFKVCQALFGTSGPVALYVEALGPPSVTCYLFTLFRSP